MLVRFAMVARFEFARLLRYDPRLTQVYVLRILPVAKSFIRVPRPHRVEIQRFT